MNTAFKPLSWGLLWAVTAGLATAQQPSPAPPPAAAAPATPAAGTGVPAAAPKSTAQLDAGEPRADTSPTAAGSQTPDASAAAAPPAATAGRPPASPHAAPQAAGPGRASGATGQKAPGAADRVELGTATVTGDREQPKVMYIVPWKKSDIGDLSGKPMNSLLDEALAPVDRDEFRREVAYFDAVNADAPQNGAQAPASKQGEK